MILKLGPSLIGMGSQKGGLAIVRILKFWIERVLKFTIDQTGVCTNIIGIFLRGS